MNTGIQLAYLVASVLFILGIKYLGKTKDARKGNFVSALGMLIAIVATLLTLNILTLLEIGVCVLIGSAIGLYYAYKVPMTKIPEMVALFNGFGGLASFAVALSEGRNVIDAVRFGCATAGISVTRPGTAPAMPSRSEIDALLAR